MDNFIPGSPEVSGNPRDFLSVLRPTSKGEAIDSAIHEVTFNGTSNYVQFSIWQLHILDILHDGDRE